MLDVHPPHAPTHTWRDFFIHIGTIVVGLLIAVGLEQTVEALHRAAERRELLHDIDVECENNLKLFGPDMTFYQALIRWDTAATVALRTAPVVRGSIAVVVPALVLPPEARAPSRSVWLVAKASGKVALLPENLAGVFDRVDRQAEQTLLAIDRSNQAETAIDNFAMKTGAEPDPGKTLRLTLAQRDELLTLLSARIGEDRSVVGWTSWWQGASEAVLHGIAARDEVDAYMDRARAALQTH